MTARRGSIALLLVVLGGRLWLVDRAGSDLPLWDQWWVDFETIVVPLSEGRLEFSALVTPHNEHHLFFQRLSTMALMAASGRWEPRDGLLVSALARSIELAVIFLVLSRNQPQPVRGILLVLLALLGALPIGTFNLLSGFQLQFFLAELLSVLTLALLFLGRLTLERVAAASSLLLVALLNMATPLITALGAVAVLTLRTALNRRNWARNAAAIAALSVFVIFTFLTTPRSTYLQAGSALEFAQVFSRLAAWPFPDAAAVGIMALGPLLLLLHRLTKHPKGSGSSWFVLSLAVVSWLQIGAIAFARARTGLSNFPQYIDGLWFGHVVSLLAMAEALRPRPGESGESQTKACAAWGAWLLVALVADCSFRGVPDVEQVRLAVAQRQPAFAAALQAGDLGVFGEERKQLGNLLFFDHPIGRFVLSPRAYSRLAAEESRRRVLPLLPATLVGAETSWFSASLNLMARSGPLLLCLGLILLVRSCVPASTHH